MVLNALYQLMNKYNSIVIVFTIKLKIITIRALVRYNPPFLLIKNRHGYGHAGRTFGASPAIINICYNILTCKLVQVDLCVSL